MIINENGRITTKYIELTTKIDKLDYKKVDYIDEILVLKDQIKGLESENFTLEEQIEFLKEQIELMGGY